MKGMGGKTDRFFLLKVKSEQGNFSKTRLTS